MESFCFRRKIRALQLAQSAATALLMIAVAAIACERTADDVAAREIFVDFRLAFEAAGACPGTCREFEVMTPLSETRSLYVPSPPGVSIPRDQIIAGQVWPSTGSARNLALLLTEDASGRLATWAQRTVSQINDNVLVTIGDSAIGAVSGPVLANTQGVLVLSLSEKSAGDVKRMLKVRTVADVALTASEMVSACDAIAGNDEHLRYRCLGLSQEGIARDREVLDRIESELDSGNPDYDAILRELGTD